MRAIIDIFLAILFLVVIGSRSMKLLNNQIKKESLIKVQKGLSSLESYTKKLTN